MKIKFTHYLFSILILTIPVLSSFAQESLTITGTVTSAADGETLPGVTVIVKDKDVATQTDADGNYSIVAQANDILVFSYLGFSRQEVPINNRSIIDVALESEGQALDEVIVIGYGTAQKKDLTGSITTVKGQDVADKPSTNPISSIQGKVAGVQVVNSGQPGVEPDVRIRGTNSINSVKPLYVVDGILNDNINFINPADIESMEILKDPSSLAIFGVRGANGVIIINTKRAKTGELNFNFNSTVGFKTVADRMALTDASGFKLLYDEQLANEGNPPFDYTNWQGNTNWQDEIFHNGILNYNNLSVSGATEKNKFYMGLGYTTEQGLILHEKMNKISLSLNDELQLSDRFKVGVNFNGYRSELPQLRGVAAAIRAVPIAPVFNDQYGLYHTLPSFQRAQIWNPLVDIDDRKNTSINREYRAVGSVFGEVNFLEHFTFRASLLADYGFNQGRGYSPLINVYNPDIAGESKIDRLNEVTSVNQFQNIFTKVQSDWLLTYKNTFDDHSLTAMVGWTSYYNSFEETRSSRSQGSGDPIPNDPRFWYVNIGATDTQIGDGSAWERTTLSFLSRALYSYKGRYLVNASFRRDGTSGFFKYGNQWQNFGAIGAAWVLSQEGFMEDQQVFDNLKIKGSWGVLGNQNTGGNQYPLYPLLVSGNSAVFGDDVIPAYEPSYIPDKNLRWEVVHAWESGFELSSFQSRLSVEAVYYDKVTKGIIVTRPGLLGTRPGLSNAGEVRNNGIELATTWSQEINSDLAFSVSGNLTTLNNKVVSLVEEGYQIFDGISRTTTGSPIGYFYGYISDGVYQTAEEIRVSPQNTINEVKVGDLKYLDINADDVINEQDRTLIGNPTPDFMYGISLNLTYKKLDFSADFMGVYGNEIFKDWNRNAFAQFNFQEERLDRWHGVGTSNWEPILHSGRSNNRLASSYWIEDGSFFRVRNIQVGYQPISNATTNSKLKTLRIFLNAQNPFTFANSTGFSPEIGGSATSFGVDNGTYPVPAIYTLGVNLNF
jgi:TonB-linked SusC/RagA family outer membrane protein